MTEENLLKGFNDFFTRTNIRKYCATICHGECCSMSGCYAKVYNDWEHCHQKLSCTSYTCHSIWRLIESCLSDDGKFDEMEYELRNKIHEHLYTNLEGNDINIFFTHYCLYKFNPGLSFPEYPEEVYAKIRKIIDKAVEEKRDRFNLR